MTFTLPGFNTFVRDGIELAGDFTASINAELRVGSLEETITVTGEAPVVDVQNVSRQSVLTNEVVEAVPTGKYFVNLGVLIPGVSASCSAACQGGNSQDTGGDRGDSSATLVAHGSRFRDQRVAINGMTVRGATGYLGVTGPNIEAQQETQIDTSGADASVGTGGVRINVVPKDGGNTFSGGLFLTGTNENFQGDNVDQELSDRGLAGNPEVKKIYDFAPTFGGPIKQDKLWFFLSYRRSNAENYAANLFENLNKNKQNEWVYVPDTSQAGGARQPAADGGHPPDVAGDTAQQDRRLVRLSRSVPVPEPRGRRHGAGSGGELHVPAAAHRDGDLVLAGDQPPASRGHRRGADRGLGQSAGGRRR